MDYEPGTVVYWNSWYDGMWHFLAVYDGSEWWPIETAFTEEPYQGDDLPINPPEDAIVVYVGGTGRLNAEQFNETMYQYYKQKRYTYK